MDSGVRYLPRAAEKGTDRKRHEKHEADAKNHGEGEEAASNSIPDARTLRGRDPKNGIQGILKLSEDA